MNLTEAASLDTLENEHPPTKSPRMEGKDFQTGALLAMSRYCQEQWVREMVLLHMSRGTSMKLALLSGDAGCGKSHAISMLLKTLKSMNISCVVSAMTNKAASNLSELCPLDQVYTFHKMMGFTKELLNDTHPLSEFMEMYARVHRAVMLPFQALYCHTLPTCQRHSCQRLRPESCGMCSKRFRRLRTSKTPTDQVTMEHAPPFLGVNVLVIDEYGLMNAPLLERMLGCCKLFYGPSNGPLIIFSGSVSQLQPVGKASRIWETDRFEKLLAHSTPLFVNRRQFHDPGYAEAVTYLQFNTITQKSQLIFQGQTTVSEQQLMNPEYRPDALRIFHQDEQQSKYVTAHMNMVAKTGKVWEKCLTVARTRSLANGPSAWYEVMKQAAQALPKLFAVPKYRPGVRTKDRDYLRVDRLWKGCKVRLIWHMDCNGIHISRTNSLSVVDPLSSFLHRSNGQVGKTSVNIDTEGIVEGSSFQRKTKCYEFHVRGSQSGTLYTVAPSTWEYKNWTVTTHPLACLLAMNTYDCQGSTVQGHILYHPPKCFSMSPIKPSVYVVLSRVSRRENLKMTSCHFADSIGKVEFYPEQLVAYRKRVEMNYSL